ncbi:PREDICTED: histone-lysine N-methyltransferase, H3 lysine-79 specific-like [Ceratosolen solmsi marchali]|uniref:Histone-lysine N-methyltransferase, H3 lysine-79 specific-like n=1 Tax=Ceratosolen solmsi marchali TaxID=326594 RepID=A0AAJ6YTT8_9HYME|nr:PREDICTED: histone-lysine N-methyltransferase, H3 lysine-79 specific-like [Ceratosolen solmsi marchali]
MFVNGWRPLNTNYDNVAIPVASSNNFDRSLTPHHQVIGKLQDHMTVSERLKPQRFEKPHQIEYTPTNLLGSFSIFSHVLPKQRGENPSSTEPKTLSTEREYTFLVPPPRDSLRFDVESQKKLPIRDNEPFVRSSQYVSQAIKPDSRAPTYYIKPASYSTNVNSFSQGRPFVNGYSAQQSLIPTRHSGKQYEELKSSNEKPYYQTSNMKVSIGFGKDKVNDDQAFDHFQQQPKGQQISNSNFYNQINHAAHYKQATYERDPSFLVHESHEVSYVTPSSYKYRPLSYYFDNSVQDAYTSSTVPSRLESNKFTQQQTPSSTRPAGFKQFQTSTKNVDKHHPESHHSLSNTFYISDFQKTRYTPDINEVLPKTNQPAKFNQVSTTAMPYLSDHNSKVVYVRPELQHQQYPSSIIPLNINQRPPEVEYETPESISLKHFNEQQFLLQQQLIEQDRKRLREQEKRRQQELQRQQQEELDRRQQEIKLLEQKEKEKQLEELQTIQPDIIKEVPLRHHYVQYPIQEQKIIPKEQYKYTYYQQQYESPKEISSETPVEINKENSLFKPITIQKNEEIVTPADTESTTQEEFQPIIRPYRPLKPFRDQVRRRKPTTVIYEHIPTELPTQYNSETSESLTDIPIQTTSLPETTTTQTPERAIRTRRPGGPLRRRRPSTTTTTTQEPNEYEEEIIKYNTPAVQDFEKKKRLRPIASNYQENSNERRLIRKRPGNRAKIYNKERDNTNTVPERIKSTDQSLRDISPTENYPAPFLKELYSSEYLSTSDKTLTQDNSQEVQTENIPSEYYFETTATSTLEYLEPSHDDHRVEHNTQKVDDNGSLDNIFTKTEVNHVETTPTTTSTYLTTSSTSTMSTTSEPSTTTKTVIASSKTTHRMRPIRYGNATRPRFSIKDYKSRLDYKTRLSQPSSTEVATVTATPKLRSHKNQQNPADPSFKEAVGRYKYTPRSPYRISTTTTGGLQSDDNNSATTDRSIRFSHKKRINANQYYRNRISGTTPLNSNKQDQEHAISQSTTRPENLYISGIRKRPALKNRPQLLERNKVVESTEMQSAAETGFFATTTTSSSPTDAANEINEPKEAIAEESKKPAIEIQEEKLSVDLSDVTMDETEDSNKRISPITLKATTELNHDNHAENNQRATIATTQDLTTPFDIRHEEELFAKASQSVADLTSSASALYDKPGMFKAVSPANENRLISTHLKIATDEPTLPIEAFFQDISKKN